MNRVFYLFRHGETDWNRERRCQGHTNIPLNDNGIMQAHDLAERMLDISLDVIVSSDLERALVTGRTVANKKSVPLIIDPRLREMSYGEAEGLLFEDAITAFGNETWMRLQSFKAEYDHVGFPGGETRRASRERFIETLMHLIEKTDHKNIGISTHGGAIRNVLHSFLPEDHPMISIPNCVLYRLVYDVVEKKFIAEAAPFECLASAKKISES
ncbi:MAG: histidine phosphatase family protein [Bdellovibrionales bacterium]|nr:histidine phosphatase family protein [Bdellovibrionales bacterium]